MKKTLFIKNTIVLTVSALILRFAGIIFKVWLAQKIGSEGMGLYQLVFSVYVLASTFAISGTSTAVTRLVSEELALGSKKGTIKILKRAIEISLIIAIASIIILFLGADFIGKTILGDIRTVPSLKILPLALPFIGTTSCLRGYFIARRKISPNAFSQIFEQVLRIIIISLLFGKFGQNNLSAGCFAIVLGDSAAEILACLVLFIQFLHDKKNLNSLSKETYNKNKIVKQILHIAVPITSGRYLNSLLRTAENVLVPKNLALYPKNSTNALSQFGMIKGMALPLLFFPSAILNSVSTLLIPEISEAIAKKQNYIVKSACERIFKLTTVLGILFGSIFLISGREIGLLIYKDQEIGFLLKALSPIVPFMYLDSICDGILKGLDQQSFTFKTAISDSVIRIILILIFLAKSGLWGFIGIMYFSNFLTCFLNVGRLIKISGVKIDYTKTVLLPLFLALCISHFTKILLASFLNLSLLWFTIFFCAFSCVLYALAILGLKIVEKQDFLC